jgi:hypothetical protein
MNKRVLLNLLFTGVILSSACSVQTPAPLPIITNTPTRQAITPAPSATSVDATHTPLAKTTQTNTPEPTLTFTPTSTNTPLPTETLTPVPTQTPEPTATHTPSPTKIPVPSPTASPIFVPSPTEIIYPTLEPTVENGQGQEAIASACTVSTDNTYGYSPDNPVRVGGDAFGGPSRERAYLDSLCGPQGETITYYREGSVYYVDTILDIYHVSYDGSSSVVLYLDEYSYQELVAPVGFTCWTPIPLSAP